jgi:hypothetical protein
MNAPNDNPDDLRWMHRALVALCCITVAVAIGAMGGIWFAFVEACPCVAR